MPRSRRSTRTYLGHPADSFALSYWSSYLASHTYRQMESAVASSAEFAQRAGGSFNQEVVQLYQAILNRTPGQAEINTWSPRSCPSVPSPRRSSNSSEAITDQFAGVVQAMFGPGTQGLILPTTWRPSLTTPIPAKRGREPHRQRPRQRSELCLDQLPGRLHREPLSRHPPPDGQPIGRHLLADGGSTAGRVAFGSLAADFLNSTEARMDYVQSEFIALLGHGADVGTLTSLANYATRENIVILLVSSPEYFAKHGGNNTSFVQAAFLDIDAIVVTASAAQGIAGQAQCGHVANGPRSPTRSSTSGDTLLQHHHRQPTDGISSRLESQGVLRSGDSPTNAPGQPINPDPNVLNYFLGLYESGLSQEQVLSIMLNTPQYYSETSYYRGLFRALGVRN